MKGVTIGSKYITFYSVPGIALEFIKERGNYVITGVKAGNLAENNTTAISRAMTVIGQFSEKEYPVLEVTHAAYPYAITINLRELQRQGKNLGNYFTHLFDTVNFAKVFIFQHRNMAVSRDYRDQWSALYSLVHTTRRQHGDVTFPDFQAGERMKLLAVLSAHKQMSVPIKPLNSIEEKLEFLIKFAEIFKQDFEHYACLRSFIVYTCGYRYFLETAELDKFTIPANAHRCNIAATIDKITSPIDVMKDHQYIVPKIRRALNCCFRIHNFN